MDRKKQGSRFRNKFFLVLNWDTSDHLVAMTESIEKTVGWSPVLWLILDNGSKPDEWDKLRVWATDRGGRVIISKYNDMSRVATLANEGDQLARTVIIREDKNVGMIHGYNQLLDLAYKIADGESHDVVLVNTDMRVMQVGWLDDVLNWLEDRPEVGIVGMEHSRGEVCAAAIFLDTAGNWYIQGGQTKQAIPVEGESVGMGFCLVRWPVLQAYTRFSPAYEFYYKQDDDFAFRVRYNLGLQIWAYPVDCVHLGRASIIAHDYQVGPATSKIEFENMKKRNQETFAETWLWMLRGRRGGMEAERLHLDQMRIVMADRFKREMFNLQERGNDETVLGDSA